LKRPNFTRRVCRLRSKFWRQEEEKTRNGILCTPSVNPPRKQRMSFRKRSVTYVKSFLRAFTREKRYPTCFKFRFVSSPLKDGRPFTFAPALEKTGKIPNLGSGCALARLSQASLNCLFVFFRKARSRIQLLSRITAQSASLERIQIIPVLSSNVHVNGVPFL
jgi:hypothetical protein